MLETAEAVRSLAKLGGSVLDGNNECLGSCLTDARFEPGLLTFVTTLHVLKRSE
jgi:hypothetical protein